MNRPEVLVTRGKVSPAEGGKGGRSVFAGRSSSKAAASMQAWANPCNVYWLSRNEQVSGSSPLLGSLGQ
jgi:hypothetical protein